MDIEIVVEYTNKLSFKQMNGMTTLNMFLN